MGANGIENTCPCVAKMSMMILTIVVVLCVGYAKYANALECSFVKNETTPAGAFCDLGNGTRGCVDVAFVDAPPEKLFYRNQTNNCCGSCHPMYCNTLSFLVVSPSGIFHASFIKDHGQETNIPSCAKLLGFCEPATKKLCGGPWPGGEVVDDTVSQANTNMPQLLVLVCVIICYLQLFLL